MSGCGDGVIDTARGRCDDGNLIATLRPGCQADCDTFTASAATASSTPGRGLRRGCGQQRAARPPPAGPIASCPAAATTWWTTGERHATDLATLIDGDHAAQEPQLAHSRSDGDGIVDAGEVCDEGYGQQRVARRHLPDRLSAAHRCGDGVIDTARGRCDDGNLIATVLPVVRPIATPSPRLRRRHRRRQAEECDEGAANSELPDRHLSDRLSAVGLRRRRHRRPASASATDLATLIDGPDGCQERQIARNSGLTATASSTPARPSATRVSVTNSELRRRSPVVTDCRAARVDDATASSIPARSATGRQPDRRRRLPGRLLHSRSAATASRSTPGEVCDEGAANSELPDAALPDRLPVVRLTATASSIPIEDVRRRQRDRRLTSCQADCALPV